MPFFENRRWTGWLQVSRMALVIPAMLASCQMRPNPRKETSPWNTDFLSHDTDSMGFPYFNREASGPKDGRRFSFCTDFPHIREFEPLFARLFPISFTLSRPIIRACGNSGRPDPNHSRIYLRSTTRDHESLHPRLSGSRATSFTCRIMEAPVGLAWALAIGLDRGFIIPGRVAHNEVWGELEKRGGPFGQIDF